MRIVFAGTPAFAATALSALLRAGHAVPLVLTQPDRPAGRGMAAQESPVKRLALEHGLPLHQPATLKTNDARAPILEADADAMVVAAYGLILPQPALDMPRHGCINIHASLLPRWRGAAPIQRALLAGDAQTGVTIMQMDAGLDTGPMLLSGVLDIGAEDTAGTLHDRLAALGGELIVEALARLARGELAPMPQPEQGVTYAAKIDKREAELDWRRPAVELARAVRAFDPVPGALTLLHGQPLKLRGARAEPGRGQPGTVLSAGADGVLVACGEGVLRVRMLQKAGGKLLAAADFLRGTPLPAGTRLGAGP
jgi:methionyl-tRNA formyltransferase